MLGISKNSRSKKCLPLLVCLFSFMLFTILSIWRDGGYALPHHDEAIALMAAKAMESDFAWRLKLGEPPFHSIVSAIAWHRYTQNISPVTFSEIGIDLAKQDLHPPLSFWAMNRWLSFFDNGGYSQGVWLVIIQVLMAAGIIGVVVYRHTGSTAVSLFGTSLFLAGNSSLYTATWLRQYGLLAIFFAATMLITGEIAAPKKSEGQFCLLSMSLGAVCCMGMLTAYSYATVTGPIHLALLGSLLFYRYWKRSIVLAGGYCLAAIAFFTVYPGVADQVFGVSGSEKASGQVLSGLANITQMIAPVPSAIPLWAGSTMGAIVLGGAFFLAGAALWIGSKNRRDIIPLGIVLSGMIGAGVIQLFLVFLGFFPAHATGPNHMLPLWMLIVFASCTILGVYRQKSIWGLGILIVAALLTIQVVYIRHCYKIKSRTNVAYVKYLNPELVVLDNPGRGYVLPITDALRATQKVIVTEPGRLRKKIDADEMIRYGTILYLPMEDVAFPRKKEMIAHFRNRGWRAESLPVIHPGRADAVYLELNKS